jgi:ketosteroid isomerase-like protein
MSREDVEFLRGVYEPWSRGDFATADVFDPGIEFARIPPEGERGVDVAGEWRGRDEMWRALKDWLSQFSEVRFEAEEFIDLGDRVLVLSRQSGTGKASGVPVEKEQADLITLRDGKIVRWEAYWDRADAKRAAGLD